MPFVAGTVESGPNIMARRCGLVRSSAAPQSEIMGRGDYTELTCIGSLCKSDSKIRANTQNVSDVHRVGL